MSNNQTITIFLGRFADNHLIVQLQKTHAQAKFLFHWKVVPYKTFNTKMKHNSFYN